jgi:AraC family transcriptional regulator, transcriptional activator of pobA
MKSSNSLPPDFSQNDNLPIRLVAPGFGHLPPEAAAQYGLPHRLAYYFFLFVWEGATEFGIDMGKFTVGKHELAFSLPHQIRHLPATLHGSSYYKLGLTEDALARLPRHYPFLLNPLNQQKIRFDFPAATRLRTIFELLMGLLRAPDTNPDLVLAQLNSLLTEMNAAYFVADKKPMEDRLAKFIEFKVFVEDNLTEHPTIGRIAEALAVSTDSLYQLVKHYVGVSPKEFMTNRLILEARRRLYYRERSSVKELAFELGFNDPAYFSRLFKKVTGKTVAAFFRDLS